MYYIEYAINDRTPRTLGHYHQTVGLSCGAVVDGYTWPELQHCQSESYRKPEPEDEVMLRMRSSLPCARGTGQNG